MDFNQIEGSGERAGRWYSDLVGKEGHYYHRSIIIPGVLKLLKLEQSKHPFLLDVGCGEGILARVLPEWVEYMGIDASPTLIKEARMKGRKNTRFHLGDAAESFQLGGQLFTHSTLILSLQNMPHPERVFQNISSVLKPGGKLVAVLNHPCFRIIRGSDWSVDREAGIQYRRISSYMKERKLPIKLNPSKMEKSKNTYSYHYPLAVLFNALSQAGFLVDQLEEWCSNKKSTGKMARVENFARKEIPLFMALSAVKA